MNEFVRKNLKTLLFFAIAGLVGGFFTGLFVLDSYPAEIQAQILAEGLTPVLIGVVTAFQSLGYGVILGAIGIFLAERVGLWKYEHKIECRPLLWTVAVAVISGLMIILLDIFYFVNISEAIADSYLEKPNVVFVIASVLYGGVIEEVMLRLFLMSLVAFILHKIFDKNGEVSTAVLVIANVISALIFSAGHLPATFVMIGNSPVIIARCFIMNGGAGLMFGWLYRKYGLRYSMLAHAGCHVVMKLIWILFVK